VLQPLLAALDNSKKNETMREVNNKELNPKETLRILWRGFIISVASVLAALAKRNK